LRGGILISQLMEAAAAADAERGSQKLTKYLTQLKDSDPATKWCQHN